MKNFRQTRYTLLALLSAVAFVPAAPFAAAAPAAVADEVYAFEWQTPRYWHGDMAVELNWTTTGECWFTASITVPSREDPEQWYLLTAGFVKQDYYIAGMSYSTHFRHNGNLTGWAVDVRPATGGTRVGFNVLWSTGPIAGPETFWLVADLGLEWRVPEEQADVFRALGLFLECTAPVSVSFAGSRDITTFSLGRGDGDGVTVFTGAAVSVATETSSYAPRVFDNERVVTRVVNFVSRAGLSELNFDLATPDGPVDYYNRQVIAGNSHREMFYHEGPAGVYQADWSRTVVAADIAIFAGATAGFDELESLDELL